MICAWCGGTLASHPDWEAIQCLANISKIKRPREMRDGPFNDEVTRISDELYAYIVRLEKLYEELSDQSDRRMNNDSSWL